MKNKSNASLSLRKLLISALVAAPLATLPVPLWALPASQAALDATVSSKTGVASVTLTNATTVDVTATATNSLVKWNDFGGGGMTINAGDTVNFNLGSSSNSILNMVVGSNATTVNGTLKADGNLYILNQNGITIGATGILTANSIGLSTVPETEYNFLVNGTLAFTENQNIATSNKVTVSPGAVLTAASGTGNIWIAADGADLAGTLDAGTVKVTSTTTSAGGPAAVNLGKGGNMVIGDTLTRNSMLTVNSGSSSVTNTGAITVGDAVANSNVVVYGPSATLTSGNATIAMAGTGVLQVGAGGSANASVTATSGTANTTLKAQNLGTGTLTVNGTGNIVSITDPSGNLAVTGTTSSDLDATASTGDLTIKASTVGGNLNATSTVGNIWAGGNSTVAGTATYTVTTGKDIAMAGNVTTLSLVNSGGGALGNVTLNSTAGLTVPALTAASLTATAVKDLGFAGAQTITNGVTVTSTTGAVNLNQSISATSLSATTSSAKDITQTVAKTLPHGGTTTVTLNSGGNVSLDAIGADKLSVTATGDIAAGGAIADTTSAMLKAGGNVTVSSTIDTPSLSVTSTSGNTSIGATIGATTMGNVTLSSGGTIATSAAVNATTLSATATGNITIGAALSDTTGTLSSGNTIAFNGAVTSPTLSASAAKMTQTAAITAATKATLDASTSIDLTGASNSLATLVIKNAPSDAKVNTAAGVTLGNGTAATGNVTINGSKTGTGTVALGAASADVISVSGNLTIDNTGTANSSVTEASDNVTVGGNISVSTAGTGTVTLAGSGHGIGLNSSYGQVNVTTAGGNATVFENTTLNLGAISLGGGDLIAYSKSSIENTGMLTVNNVLVGAGTAVAPGDIALNYYKDATHFNTISGTIHIGTDLGLLGSSTLGYYLAKSLNVNVGATGAGPLLDIPNNIYGSGASADLTLTAKGAASLNLGGGALNTTGMVNLAADTGTITANNAGNTFSNLTVTSNGPVAVSSTKSLTITGTTAGGASAVGYTSGGNITLANYSDSNSGTTSFTAASGTIMDSNPGLNFQGPVSFTGKALSITQAGHNFGGVSIDTHASNGNATIVEGGTLHLVSVNTGSGSLTATSSSGDVMEGSDHSGTITTTGATTLTAPMGAVTLDGANSIGGTLNFTAAKASVAKNTVDTALGNVTVGSAGLTVDLTGTSGKKITEASGAKIYTYGATAFKVAGATAGITIGNTGNQFGNLTLTTGGGDVKLTEWTTLNMSSVNTSGGALTITSEGGDIIDTGTITSTGTTAFSAPHGNINLTKTASDYGVVTLNTTGNASISDTNSIILDTSTVGGALTVTAGSTAGDNIGQMGALTIGGNTILTAAAGAITFNNTANQFGAVRFKAGAASILDEATSFNLMSGTVATAAVTINTGSDFLTSGIGGSSFTNNLTINATGTIIPGAGSMLVTGTFTVNSGNTKDLSALSLSGNLAGNTPVNQGSGTYVAPSP